MKPNSPQNPIRVGLLNNYSMRKAWAAYEAGSYPGQHLWGVVPSNPSLEWVVPAGMFDVRRGPRWFELLRKFILRILGDPIQVVGVLRARVDVVYAADQWSGAMVGILRRVHLYTGPYVVLVHHPPSSAWNRFCLRGASLALVLSDGVGDVVARELRVARSEVVAMPWGPDRDWIGYQNVDSTKVWDVVAAGRTNRDYISLREAIRIGRFDAKVVDGHNIEVYKQGELVSTTPGAMNYVEIARMIAAARTVVVPLSDPGIMAGLTEMADASALGVPVVATFSDRLPYDVEGLGCGHTAPPSDGGALAATVRRAIDQSANYSITTVETFNAESYARYLTAQFELVVGPSPRSVDTGFVVRRPA